MIEIKRPKGLPDFENPPINEVVLSVQFAPPSGYSQAYITEIWNLFRQQYPKVQEKDPLPPTFEVFGPDSNIRPQGSFLLNTGPIHDRFWFSDLKDIELIQFQSDRLIHNWRRVTDRNNQYPRFENILPKFVNEYESLNSYFAKNFSSELKVTQCELSYINVIDMEGNDLAYDNWISCLDSGDHGFTGVNANMHKTLFRDGEPYARFICVIQNGQDTKKGTNVIRFELTVRGIPQDRSLHSMVEYFNDARCNIVNHFDQLTTELAHERWGKK